MKFEKPTEQKITELKVFHKLIKTERFNISHCTFQGIDFRNENIDWPKFIIDDTTFLGCKFHMEEELQLVKMGAYLYHAPDSLPYKPFRRDLYSWQELMKSSNENRSVDLEIYQHFSDTKFNTPINEALWQRIHDHAIDDALRDLLDFDDEGMTQKKCVGFMGGHSVGRDHSFFKRSAHTSKLLAESGYFITSGGGPGIMEAANLGAYMAGYSQEDLNKALNILAKAPKYTDDQYHEHALEVLNLFPEGMENLAIPTWFYGHEPSNLFASHIAKYFSNSIREDTLLAISLYGIVFAPGSAGTTQEIFMDATQNHYGTFNYYSPMVFLGRERYEIKTMIYPLLKQLAWDRAYAPLLHITDEPKEVLEFLQKHPPIKVKK